MTDSRRSRLDDYALIRTSDLDEAREAVARVFCPHRLDLDDGEKELTVVHNSTSLDKLCVNYLDYGAAVHVEPGELDSIFVVQISVAGRSHVRCGTQEIVSTPSMASVPTPTEYFDMHWEAGAPKLIVKVDRPVLEEALERLTGQALAQPIRFRLGMDLSTAAGRSWIGLLSLLVAELERGDGLIRQRLAVAHLEDALLTSLLLTQPHNYSDQLQAQDPPAPPKVVRRAIDLMEAHPKQALTTDELARSLSVGVRTLQEGFRRYIGCSPMAYLRDVRLQRIHDVLSTGSPGADSVTEVALDWGFFHLGRFAAAYRAKFGESPSQTLRGG